MDKIDELLKRGVDKIYPSKEALEKVLRSGKKIKIYIGADPTAPQLHLGHATNFLILKKLQDLGHKIIILIGDFTGMIGDPTDKLAARRPLAKEQVLENAKTYKDQLSKILRFSKENPAEIKFNSTWLSTLTLEDFIRLMAKVTFQQLIERDMFQKRLTEGKTIGLHELIYPLLQGYDSVAMDVDAEIGGTDQTFNMLMGRTLMKELKGKEKFVITTELLVNPKNGQKLMSKSEENYVGLNDNAAEMFAKIMALPDETIEPIFRLCTTVPIRKAEEIKSRLESGENPMVLKKELAFQIVSELHSPEAAQKAQNEFERVFQKREIPEETASIKIAKTRINVVDFLVENNLSSSRSQAKRLLDQGAIEIDGEILKENGVEFKEGQVVKIGKKRFVKVMLASS
ncbi:tyrosine--tRNA ligase [Candidatus Curtissbacteria bacterium RIFCSPHIGHO2_01_FULL_41_44]|uniref:Tyrosine--tRNA ligase n=1 Tax=Candidatus Curtissbacteria bacterium RIFCSPLOWO2_01_FULL_42_50 TaxID=1797730 RepID=A0A1F5H7R8_9BACT|nr:MAG: tyrosine--tRNA ligase [Candidatus Curtissbacteria bacterium RIFCSPHIGHO2_01_FULL_41_44]OGD94249.1 MAG: tyrosine--tRNA ligase [Candidatus Curtissbacteria bacterium RIFCSPHIGHO2_02_FULL_42_58]OGD97723.1 MAG: tyrosine--tRNA ligase [Candidatus Curtissbacteria bacterium RIFCSPHIGHO2_12_FULL_42_33]OGE00116.1 MAG: tyrosine--tRNA ligase [Candidatus Curtissbacteria bacterium RIFCSPLOWO2_01_FULL_42_50]OGE02041.1 MAG: tyrosine--tRNA ligase [Candidatus Curtissbacteria bacterium RIFCSPLOWO2_12_FULL_